MSQARSTLFAESLNIARKVNFNRLQSSHVAASLGLASSHIFFRVMLPSSGWRSWVADFCSPCICCRNTGSTRSLRYVHHRDFRSVSIDLQRTRGQYTSGDIGAALPRASRTRPLLEIGLWQPARTMTAKLGTMGTRRGDLAAAHHCIVRPQRASHNIDALDRHWRRKSLEHRRAQRGLPATAGIWVDCRLRKPFVGVPATPELDWLRARADYFVRRDVEWAIVRIERCGSTVFSIR